MEYCKKYRIIHIIISIFLLVACQANDQGEKSNVGGGGNGGGAQLDADQAAFSTTLYPLLETHCVTCHSEKSQQDIQLANFAHGNIVIAHAVVINRDLVNRDAPENSRFVERLQADKHFCWSSCAEDATAVSTAIARWNDLAAKDAVGTTTNTDLQTSVDAFEQTLQPTLRQNCATCHDGSLAISGFASTNAETAHEVILNRGLVDLQDPEASRFVDYLANRQHNCWSDCASNAAKLENDISAWQALLNTNPGTGNNRNPIAVNDTYTGPAGVVLVTGNVLLNDSDADNDTLAINGFDAFSRQGARVENNLNGTFTYNTLAGFSGTDSFNYTINDGNGGSDSGTVNITINLNSAPVAVDDKIKTNQNTPVTISNLLSNDIGVSNSTLSIISVDNVSQNGGFVVINTSSTVTYTPPTDATGLDRFTYTISDGSAIATAQVEIDINAQPVAVSDAVYTYVNLTASTGNVLDNDRDTNGDTLTISSFDSGTAQAGSVSISGNGIFTYVPPLNFEGNDSFDYIVSDGRGGTATATVFLTVTNPTLRDDNRFLSFLNQTAPLANENAQTATAYYRAIDPLDQRTNLEDWRVQSGFEIGADAFATYINNNDLGFARRMFVRTDPVTGIVSSYVENYANLSDALNEINLIATVAMDYTVAPGQDPLDPDAKRYTTFYVFDGNDNRVLGADLDGRGFKFIPGLCNTCHGGRPLAVQNGVYPGNGDVGGGFIPWDLDTYLFNDATASVSRANQETQFKIFNQTVLKTNPTAAARQAIEGWYGGATLPANIFNGNFVPEGWLTPAAPANATQLYLQVVAPFCRACHVMRGNALQSDIDLASYDKFMSYKHRIETLIYDEGVMPLALRTFDRFWDNSIVPETLAAFLDSSKALEDNIVLLPGRPLANPGPFREAALGRIDLNGNGSLFTGGGSAFNWSLVTRPAESRASIQNANQAKASFIADIPGDYILQLVVNDGVNSTPASPPGEVVIRVSPTVRGTSFVSDIAPIFDQCAVCHLGFDNPRFNNFQTLYNNVIDYVNQDDPVHSPILTKPSGKHHAGGTINGFETTAGEKYQLLLRWIVEGAVDN